MVDNKRALVQNLSPKIPSQMTGFGDLPVELLHSILGYLPWKGWMWSMLLVCRKFNIVTLPHLYKKLVVVVDYMLNRMTVGMLDKKNRGLKYVRELEINNITQIPITSWHYETSLILESLPRDILRKFRWNPLSTLAASVIRILWGRQRKLENIEIIPCSTPMDNPFWVDGKPISDDMDNLNALLVRQSRDQIPREAIFLLKNKPKINSLTLDFAPRVSGAEKLEETECQHLFGISRSLPISIYSFALQDLELRGVNLRCSPTSIIPALRFDKLKTLTISACNRPDYFLFALIRDADQSPPRLESLKICHTRFENDFIVETIEDFLLSSRNCLTNLWITIRASDILPKAAAISAHASTLRTLFLDVRRIACIISHSIDNGYAVYHNLEDWELLCGNLHNLEQLAAAFPGVTVGAFSNVYMHPQFSEYLESTSQITHLKTLNITTLPLQDDSFTYSLSYSQPLLQHHARLAEAIVRLRQKRCAKQYGTGHKAFSPLEIVVLGIQTLSCAESEIICFERLGRSIESIELDPTNLGGVMPTMQLVTLEELQKHQQPVDVVGWGSNHKEFPRYGRI